MSRTCIFHRLRKSVFLFLFRFAVFPKCPLFLKQQLRNNIGRLIARFLTARETLRFGRRIEKVRNVASRPALPEFARKRAGNQTRLFCRNGNSPAAVRTPSPRAERPAAVFGTDGTFPTRRRLQERSERGSPMSFHGFVPKQRSGDTGAM